MNNKCEYVKKMKKFSTFFNFFQLFSTFFNFFQLIQIFTIYKYKSLILADKRMVDIKSIQG